MNKYLGETLMIDSSRLKIDFSLSKLLFMGLVFLSLLFFSSCSKNNADGPMSVEKIPEISLTTNEGKLTSAKFLKDDKPEFLLFISPN